MRQRNAFRLLIKCLLRTGCSLFGGGAQRAPLGVRAWPGRGPRGPDSGERNIDAKCPSVAPGSHPDRGWSPRPLGLPDDAANNRTAPPGLSLSFYPWLRLPAGPCWHERLLAGEAGETLAQPLPGFPNFSHPLTPGGPVFPQPAVRVHAVTRRGDRPPPPPRAQVPPRGGSGRQGRVRPTQSGRSIRRLGRRPGSEPPARLPGSVSAGAAGCDEE